MAELLGRVLSVDTRNAAENTVSDAAVGASVLYVNDAAPFAGGSGAFLVDGTAYAYVSADLDADTLLLASPLTTALPADSRCEVFPPSPEKLATVEVGGGGESTEVLVPHALVELLPDGIRDPLDQETVTIETGGDALIITDVRGMPLAQGVVAQWRLDPQLVALITMRFDDAASRDALIPVPLEGMSAYLADTGLQYAYSGGQWVPQLVYVKKAANTSVASSTTLIDDPHLFVDLVPGTYRVELFVHGTGANSGGDIKAAWSYSGGAIVTGNRTARGMAVAGTDGTGALARSSGHFVDTAVAYGLEAAATDAFSEDILLRVATSGRFQMRWAQNVADSTPTTVTAASRIYITRLADRT
ncbi:hypothetical protein [Microlunatus antarcticus]|uniref:Uncharacterized protein n=1 Tax=Microlunatus antarcticus TaxID=53388 RepID=A0A7W5P7D7_9ACTN|nr:hypothetical protein [Microlunatus antarcticus]MBB3327469.1 hypothetical protein [Microlunatus antarcticus]